MRIDPIFCSCGFRRKLMATVVAIAASSLVDAYGASAAEEAGAWVRPYIIGGEDVPQGRFPFVASLQFDDEDIPDRYHYCGGSLISPSVVLTAAHCVAGLEDPANAEVVEKMSIILNRADLRHGFIGEERRVARGFSGDFLIRIHPRYREGEGRIPYDVAVIVLDRPVTSVEPARLPTPGSDTLERPGTSLTAAGWGNTSTDPYAPVTPDILQSVTVPVVSNWECAFAYPGGFMEGVHICAGVTGRDSCQGDSGGPLFATRPGISSVVQVGVVSWGEGCAKTGKPGVYAKLSDPEIAEFIAAYTGL